MFSILSKTIISLGTYFYFVKGSPFVVVVFPLPKMSMSFQFSSTSLQLKEILNFSKQVQHLLRAEFKNFKFFQYFCNMFDLVL